MIDINLLRKDKGGNPDLVKESQRKRGGQPAVDLVDQVLALDDDWKKARFKADEMNKQINQIGKQMAPLAKQKMLDSPEAKALLAEKARLESLKLQLTQEANEKEKLLNSKLNLIGNLVHSSCIDSKDEANNERTRLWWPQGRSEAQEMEKKASLIKKDGKGVPGLYSHHEVLDKIQGYDSARGILSIF